MRKRILLQAALLIATMLLATVCMAKAPAAAAANASAVPAGIAPAAATPVEGTDYFLIANPDRPSGRMVQITEVFGYGCIHCAHFQPYLAAWAKRMPAGVQLNYLPGPFGGLPDQFTRAFYAAQALGVQEKSHDAIFKAVFVDKRVATADDIPKLYADYGIDPKVFATTMQSLAVAAKVAAANDQAARWGIEGTPTMVIDGKYRVMETTAGGPTVFLRTVDWLIARQRPEHARH